MKQRDVFLESEGDAWFGRNPTAAWARDFPRSDLMLTELAELFPAPAPTTRVLEIGCGDGVRLEWLRQHRGFQCFGIDPSEQAVSAARQRGLTASRGTADSLPFGDREFDVVLFGFCLYLCDRDDLFRIASEADRVLRDPGWLLILDFYSPVPLRREYHHRPGLFSHKMDYRTLFAWHPAYTTLTHKVRHHVDGTYTDDAQDWVAVSVLRKNSGAP